MVGNIFGTSHLRIAKLNTTFFVFYCSNNSKSIFRFWTGYGNAVNISLVGVAVQERLELVLVLRKSSNFSSRSRSPKRAKSADANPDESQKVLTLVTHPLLV